MKRFQKIALVALVIGVFAPYSARAGGPPWAGAMDEAEMMRQQFIGVHGPVEGERRFEEWRRDQDVVRDAAPIRERWLRYEREGMAGRETDKRRLLEEQEAGAYQFLHADLHEAVQQAAAALNERAGELEREADLAMQSADWRQLTQARPLRERAERLRVEAVRLLELFPAPAAVEVADDEFEVWGGGSEYGDDIDDAPSEEEIEVE